MWHSQILGSFEAKNITCVILHENSFFVIEIIKHIFPDDKKYKKVQKKWSKGAFLQQFSKLNFLALWPNTDPCFLTKWRTLGAGGRTKPAEKDRQWTQWFWASCDEWIHPQVVDKSGG